MQKNLIHFFLQELPPRGKLPLWKSSHHRLQNKNYFAQDSNKNNDSSGKRMLNLFVAFYILREILPVKFDPFQTILTFQRGNVTSQEFRKFFYFLFFNNLSSFVSHEECWIDGFQERNRKTFTCFLESFNSPSCLLLVSPSCEDFNLSILYLLKSQGEIVYFIISLFRNMHKYHVHHTSM